MLKLLPEPSQGLPRVKANEEEDGGVGKHEKFELERREIIAVLLEFPSRFLKRFKGQMVDTVTGQLPWVEGRFDLNY